MTEALLLHVVLIAGGCFGVVKLLFAFLGWYSRDYSDRLYRAQLDKLFDELHQMRLHEVFIAALSKLLTRLSETFRSPGWALFVAAVTAVALSSIAVNLALALLLWDDPDFIWNDWSFGRVLLRVAGLVWDRMPPVAVYAVLVSSVIGTAMAALTWLLARRMQDAKSVMGLLMHVAVSISATFLAICLMYGALVAGMVLPDYRWHGEFSQHLAFYAALTLDRRPGIFLSMASFFGFVAALPTVIYGLVCGLAMFLRALPDVVRRQVVRILYLVSTDKEPVLASAGNFFGAMAALCGAVVTIYK